MESNINKKIITVAAVLSAFLAAIVFRVLFESLATSFGPLARLYAQDWFQHGVPLTIGLLTFSVLQFHKGIQTWADEVVTELLKVVWVSRKDLIAMSIVVCVMLIISSVILGVFDFLSRNLVTGIIN